MICDLLATFSQLFLALLSVSFAVAVLLAVFSGFAYVLALGNATLLAKAKKALRATIIGFAICLLSWTIINSVFLFLGYQGDWWRMKCEVTESANNALYQNEIAPDSLGGRNNPIALSELSQQKLDEIPEGQYFYIHGLNGQPLNDAAEQVAAIAENAKAQNRIVYAAAPARDPGTNQIIGSNLFNLANLVSSNRTLTVNNAKSWIVRALSEGTSSEIPLIKGISGNLPQITDWLQKPIPQDKAVVVMKNGVLFQEDRTITKNDDYSNGLDYSINLTDGKLDRDNPVSFTINRPDISPTALKNAAADIADYVGESAKDSQARNKDQYAQFSNLMAKDPGSSYLPSDYTASDYVFGTAPAPSQVITNPGQKMTPAEITVSEAELERIATNLINAKLGSPDSRFPNDIDQGRAAGSQSPPPKIAGLSDFPVMPDTPQLDKKIADEQEFVGGLNVSRVDNYDPSRLSPVGGKTNTNNILGLDERESIRDMLLDIQKEMAQTAQKMGGKGMNVPVKLQMCLFYKETLHKTKKNSKGKWEMESFDASAKSVSGCSGLGQLNMKGVRIGAQYLKKYAPKHFQALKDKVKKDFGVDMERTLTCDPEKDRRCKNEPKRNLLRRDPNLNAAVSYALLNEKAQGGINGKNRPISNIENGSAQLRALAKGFGPGDVGPYADPKYADVVMWCYQNDAWRKLSEAGRLAAATRKNK